LKPSAASRFAEEGLIEVRKYLKSYVERLRAVVGGRLRQPTTGPAVGPR
jgi:hypothetical protein